MTTNPETPRGGRSYVRAWHALLVLFVLGLAVSAYVHFAIYGYTLGPRTWGRSLGETLGGGFFLAALPVIVIVPWRLAQRRRGPTNAPIAVGAILFTIVAAMFLKGAAIP